MDGQGGTMLIQYITKYITTVSYGHMKWHIGRIINNP